MLGVIVDAFARSCSLEKFLRSKLSRTRAQAGISILVRGAHERRCYGLDIPPQTPVVGDTARDSTGSGEARTITPSIVQGFGQLQKCGYRFLANLHTHERAAKLHYLQVHWL